MPTNKSKGWVVLVPAANNGGNGWLDLSTIRKTQDESIAAFLSTDPSMVWGNYVDMGYLIVKVSVAIIDNRGKEG